MKNLLLFVILLISSISVYAQSTTPSLSERAKTSDAIFEGKVIKREGFRNESNTRIFTKNYIQVSRYLKGSGGDIFELITQGGEVRDVFQEISHGITFDIGQEGMFLCRNFQVEPLGNQTYLMLNGSGGFLPYLRTSTETIIFDHNTTYHNLTKEVYPQIGYFERQTAMPRTSLSEPARSGQIIEFEFANLNIIGISSIEFDVFVKSSVSPVKFAGGSLLGTCRK